MKDILLIEITSLLRNNIEWCIFSFMIRLCHFYFRGSTKLWLPTVINHLMMNSINRAITWLEIESQSHAPEPHKVWVIKYDSYYKLYISLYCGRIHLSHSNIVLLAFSKLYSFQTIWFSSYWGVSLQAFKFLAFQELDWCPNEVTKSVYDVWSEFGWMFY